MLFINSILNPSPSILLSIRQIDPDLFLLPDGLGAALFRITSNTYYLP